MSLLDISGLEAGYGDVRVLHEVDLHVEDGEWVVIVGPNGAGKSTLIKTVFGLADHTGGTITFRGEPMTDLQSKEIIRRGIGYVPQSDNVFPPLTVAENLRMGAYILDEVPEDTLAEIYDLFPILEERRSQRAGSLSGGQRQMLAMGRALMLDPDVLLLDEPSAGLAPDLVEETFERIEYINDTGTAVLMVEQNAKQALERGDRGYVLVQGENRFTDTADELLGNEEVRQEFLGG
jgi:ABC-type branched-subunit amino acid transport system ATPase component